MSCAQRYLEGSRKIRLVVKSCYGGWITSLSALGNENSDEKSFSVTPFQCVSKRVAKHSLSWGACNVCVWAWGEMLSEQTWMLLKTGINWGFLSLGNSDPEGFCSGFFTVFEWLKLWKPVRRGCSSAWETQSPKVSSGSTANVSSECFGLYFFVVMQPQMPLRFCHFKSGLSRDFFLSRTIRVFLFSLAHQEERSIFIS